MKKINPISLLLSFGGIIALFGYIVPQLITTWLPMLDAYMSKLLDSISWMYWVCRVIVYLTITFGIGYFITYSALLLIGYLLIIFGFDNKDNEK